MPWFVRSTRAALRQGACFAAMALLSAGPAGAEAAGDAAAPTLDLLAVWKAASSQDASLRSAEAAAEAGRERVPLAVAALRPSVTLSATRFANERNSVVQGAAGSSDLRENYYSSLQTLSVRQSLYRPQQWAQLAQAEALQVQSETRYERERQNLAVRVAEAYFDVLLSNDQIDLVLSQEVNAATHLEAARKALVAGTGLRTDIEEAQARLDLTRAQALEARQQQQAALQQLSTLVTQPIGRVAALDVARFRPEPLEPLQTWLARAETASPELLSLAAQRDAAAQALERARSEWKPTLDLVAQWQRSNRQLANRADDRYTVAQIGLQLNVPLYAGGSTSATVRQAQAELTQVTEGLEAARRDLGTRVAREWRGVGEGAARVQALSQAVRSTEQALQGNRRSFSAGARTMLDVLQAQELHVNAQRDLARARYLHLVALVKLHALSGAANEALVTRVNALLRPNL